MKDDLVAYSNDFSMETASDSDVILAFIGTSPGSTSITPQKSTEFLQTEILRLDAGLKSSIKHTLSPTSERIETLTSGQDIALSIFEQLDSLRADDSAVHRQIASLRSKGLQHGEKLASRLEVLLEAYKEDYEDRVLSADSLHGFIDFLGGASSWKCPVLTATPSGEVYAQWKQDRGHLLSLLFLPTCEVKFAVFSPNPRHLERTTPITGLTTVDALAETITPLGVLEWVQE